MVEGGIDGSAVGFEGETRCLRLLLAGSVGEGGIGGRDELRASLGLGAAGELFAVPDSEAGGISVPFFVGNGWVTDLYFVRRVQKKKICFSGDLRKLSSSAGLPLWMSVVLPPTVLTILSALFSTDQMLTKSVHLATLLAWRYFSVTHLLFPSATMPTSFRKP